VARPMTMIATPAPCRMAGLFRTSTDPTSANDTPRAVKTKVNPATKSAAAPATRHRPLRGVRACSAVAGGASAPTRPAR
jgi:hypothetical protein